MFQNGCTNNAAVIVGLRICIQIHMSASLG